VTSRTPAARPRKAPSPKNRAAPHTGQRASQGDLFPFDSPLVAGVRGERSLMAFPFFALAKNAWMKPLIYSTDSVLIEVRPSATGVATIYDKEIVLYIASLMAAKLEAGEQVSQDFTFTAHDLFSVTGANQSARSYGRLSEALERLQGTQIRTNIEAGGEGEEGFFSWLSEARLHYTRVKGGEKRLKAVRVRLCDWLFRAILLDRHVLDYAHAYFQLGPIERRIYEVARSGCGPGGAEGNALDLDLATFRLQVGYQNPLANFRQALRAVAGADAIPGYRLELVEQVEEAGDRPASEGEGSARRGRRANPTRVVITPHPAEPEDAGSESASESTVA